MIPKLLLFFFPLVVFFIAIFLIFNYWKEYSLTKKRKSFLASIPTNKEQENDPDINTVNWSLHKNRLLKYRRSQYKGLTFFVSSDNRIYYLSEEGNVVYC